MRRKRRAGRAEAPTTGAEDGGETEAACPRPRQAAAGGN